MSEDTRVDSLEAKIDSLAASMAEFHASQLRMETLMENEIIPKIRVLFDAHSLYMDYFAGIRESQARLENSLESLTRRIVDLNIDLRDHEREIRLLRIERK